MALLSLSVQLTWTSSRTVATTSAWLSDPRLNSAKISLETKIPAARSRLNCRRVFSTSIPIWRFPCVGPRMVRMKMCITVTRRAQLWRYPLHHQFAKPVLNSIKMINLPGSGPILTRCQAVLVMSKARSLLKMAQLNAVYSASNRSPSTVKSMTSSLKLFTLISSVARRTSICWP